STPKFGMANTITSTARIALHITSRPGGYHSSARAVPLPPAATGLANIVRRESHQGGRPALARNPTKNTGPNKAAITSAPLRAPISADQWLQPRPAIISGSGAT